MCFEHPLNNFYYFTKKKSATVLTATLPRFHKDFLILYRSENFQRFQKSYLEQCAITLEMRKIAKPKVEFIICWNFDDLVAVLRGAILQLIFELDGIRWFTG